MFAVGRGSSGRRSKYKVDQWREAKFEVHTIVTATVKLSDVEMATEGEVRTHPCHFGAHTFRARWFLSMHAAEVLTVFVCGATRIARESNSCS